MHNNDYADDQLYRLMAAFYMIGDNEIREYFIALICAHRGACQQQTPAPTPSRVEAKEQAPASR